MSIRMACVASLFFVKGWWILVAAIGGVLLPYLAVIFANEPDHNAHERPEPIAPLELTGARPSHNQEPQTVVIVDAPAERRSNVEQDTLKNTDEEPVTQREEHPDSVRHDRLQQ